MTSQRPGRIWAYPVAAATTLYQGTMIALDSSGNAVSAADTAGLRVIGVAIEDVDNSAGAAGDLDIQVNRSDVFLLANSGSAAVDADDKGKICYVADNQTVAETSTNKVQAGIVEDVETAGVWVRMRESPVVPTAVTITGTAATDISALHAALVTAGIVK